MAMNLNDVKSGYGLVETINENSRTTEQALDDKLSRTESTGNEMQTPLDMNGNRVVNVAEPVEPTDAVTRKYTDRIVGIGEAGVRLRGTVTGTNGVTNLTPTALGNGSGGGGTGDHVTGDFYICSASGTFDYGGGDVTLDLDDWLILDADDNWLGVPQSEEVVEPIITKTYYERTPQEVLYNVEPADKQYPPMNVRRYGADPTDVLVDDRDAFIDCLTAYRKAFVPVGDGYYISSPIVNPPTETSIVGEVPVNGGPNPETPLSAKIYAPAGFLHSNLDNGGTSLEPAGSKRGYNIRDLVITGDADTLGIACFHGYIGGDFINLNVLNFDWGLVALSSWLIKIDKCRFHGWTDGTNSLYGECGVYLDTPNIAQVTRTEFYGYNTLLDTGRDRNYLLDPALLDASQWNTWNDSTLGSRNLTVKWNHFMCERATRQVGRFLDKCIVEENYVEIYDGTPAGDVLYPDNTVPWFEYQLCRFNESYATFRHNYLDCKSDNERPYMQVYGDSEDINAGADNVSMLVGPNRVAENDAATHWYVVGIDNTPKNYNRVRWVRFDFDYSGSDKINIKQVDNIPDMFASGEFTSDINTTAGWTPIDWDEATSNLQGLFQPTTGFQNIYQTGLYEVDVQLQLSSDVDLPDAGIRIIESGGTTHECIDAFLVGTTIPGGTVYRKNFRYRRILYLEQGQNVRVEVGNAGTIPTGQVLVRYLRHSADVYSGTISDSEF